MVYYFLLHTRAFVGTSAISMPDTVALLEVVVNRKYTLLFSFHHCKLAFRMTTTAATTTTTTATTTTTTTTTTLNNHTRTHTDYNKSCCHHCRSWIRLTWRCPPLRRTNLGWCPLARITSWHWLIEPTPSPTKRIMR